MKGINRINAAILAGTMLLGGVCTIANAEPVVQGQMIAQAPSAAVTAERQRLLAIYNRQGTKALIVELRKSTTNAAIRAERQRLLTVYNRQGRAALVADLRTSVAVRPTVRPTVAPTPVPTPEMTPYGATPEPTPYVEPTPVPAPTRTPRPMITSAPATPLPATPAPTPVPVTAIETTPAPFLSFNNLGYWAASNEAAKNSWMDNNSGFVTGNIELMPMGPDNAIGVSGNFQSYRNYTSNFWDAYVRFGALKLGYRREDLFRNGLGAIPTIRADNAFVGFGFGLPLGLAFDILGGATVNLANAPASYTADRLSVFDNRTFFDASLMFNLPAPGNWMNLSLGYRAFVFGTMGDMQDLLTMQSTRTPFFGSYQGPFASLGLRF